MSDLNETQGVSHSEAKFLCCYEPVNTVTSGENGNADDQELFSVSPLPLLRTSVPLWPNAFLKEPAEPRGLTALLSPILHYCFL